MKYVEEWIKISKEVGFTYVKNIPMSLKVRKGYGHEKDEKKEGIFLFVKGNENKMDHNEQITIYDLIDD